MSENSELYVFISYARPDAAVAETVEAALTTAGMRVFRDASDIRPGANWDLVIERALGECQRMVLLLSSASMPDRKEVHREWLYFDQERKPICPLLVEDCTLHSRFTGINYIDARADWPGALERLLDELTRDPDLPVDAATGSLTQFRHARIAEWSQPRYTLDKRFVNLTLLLDRGENEAQRWQRAEEFRFNDLRDVIARTEEHPALVLLGAPGSGKSTLLRRLQLDHSQDRLADGGDGISFFIQLNGYREDAKGERPAPREWLRARWKESYPQLSDLETFLQTGRALLLLDALNEMPHRGAGDYRELVGCWREFTRDAAARGNRILFSCRSLDYSASLSGKELRVPQVEVQPMSADQVRAFLEAYTPANAERVWRELDGKPQFGLFQTPYFLKLLCEQVESAGDVPKGRAALFTGYVRQAIGREIEGALFQPGALLDERDHRKLARNAWRDAFDLPERGALLPRLGDLAFSMQRKGFETEGAQLRIDYDAACSLVGDESILHAGVALNVLDHDLARDETLFFHQLLQEFFAARRLAKHPDSALVHTEWAAERVQPSLDETLAALADGDPLPPLPQTGWEETTLTAAPMAKDLAAFIRDLMPHNLPLAGRCAASAEVKIGDELNREIQQALVARSQDARADLRARIAAGEALGTLGDPRFPLRKGAHGDYLAPPMVEIPGGVYPMGDDQSSYDDEKPAHTVELAPFQVGRFPVTNAEYAKFMAAGGYDDPQWWDTEDSLAWLRGEGGEGAKEGQRDFRKRLQGLSEDYIRDLVKQNRITSQQADNWITIRNWTDERFEQQLDEWYPSGKLYRQPEYWDDARFNNPSQPVVGVTWFEARAYCNWLTATAASGRIYRLPTEAEFEAAARGGKGRAFPYGKKFDASRSNTFESHIRRTTPVGIFD
ncbi:MAG: NACHT domain-containing protein, partial [Blastocatellia bacterium]